MPIAKLKNQKRETPTTVVVYSESLGDRDYLRSRLEEQGYNTICFENESICIDNLKSVQPKIIIARTDSSKIAWRFVIALNLIGLNSPLVFVSNTLSVRRYGAWPSGIPFYTLPVEINDDQWIETVGQILSEKRSSNGMKALSPFLGESDAIAVIRSTMRNVVNSRDSILIMGEKGTGKELLSKNIAGSSKIEPVIVKIDCGALQPDISLSRLLTGIVEQESITKPIFIFLSNIHQMAKASQVDILIFLDHVENWISTPNRSDSHDIRIITTSEVDIEALVKQGVFRKDLFYRLNVIPISIPPLRERPADISLLMDYFIIDACIKNNKCVLIPSKKTREMMYTHDWPGNVDELRGYMERVVATGDEKSIMANTHLPELKKDKRDYLFDASSLEALPQSFEIEGFLSAESNLALKRISREFVTRTEKRFMRKALELTNWNRKKAAEMLDISYKSMLNKMKAYDII